MDEKIFCYCCNLRKRAVCHCVTVRLFPTGNHSDNDGCGAPVVGAESALGVAVNDLYDTVREPRLEKTDAGADEGGDCGRNGISVPGMQRSGRLEPGEQRRADALPVPWVRDVSSRHGKEKEMKGMFIFGLLFGLFLGSVFGIVIAAILSANRAKDSEDQED